MNLAFIALMASLVAKEVVEPRNAAIAVAGVLSVFELALGHHPVPLVLSYAVYVPVLWGTFYVIRYGRMYFLPFAIAASLAAVLGVGVLHDWLQDTLEMRPTSVEERIEELERQTDGTKKEDGGVIEGAEG